METPSTWILTEMVGNQKGVRRMTNKVEYKIKVRYSEFFNSVIFEVWQRDTDGGYNFLVERWTYVQPYDWDIIISQVIPMYNL